VALKRGTDRIAPPAGSNRDDPRRAQLGWQESLMQLAKLVEPDIPDA
jgi:hypothetical protein